MPQREAITGRIGAGMGIEEITPAQAIRNLEKALERNPESSLADKMRARIAELKKPGAKIN